MYKTIVKKRKVTISKNNLIIFILFLIYKFILDYSYKSFTFGLYEYSGFKYNFDLIKYIETCIYSLILFYITPKIGDRVSSVFLNLQFAVMIMPMLTIYNFMDFNRMFLLFIILCHVIQVILLKDKTGPIKFRVTGISRLTRLFIPILLVLIFIVSILKNGVPSLKALNIYNVYEIRSEATLPFGFGYFLSWACKVIIPFCIVLYWQRRNKFMTIFYALMQLLLYMIYAHKTFLFIIPVIFVVIYILKKNMMIKGLYGGLIIGIVGSLIIYFINNKYIIVPSMFIRRFLFTPAFLKNMYFEFYSMGPKNWFAHGLIGNLFNVKANYPHITSTMIATYIHGTYWTGANTGYLGDAYAQGGFLMMITFTVLLSYIIRLIEKCSDNLDNNFVIASSIYIFLTLNDGALLTTLLTGGLIVYILILYAFNSDNNKYKIFKGKYIGDNSNG